MLHASEKAAKQQSRSNRLFQPGPANIVFLIMKPKNHPEKAAKRCKIPFPTNTMVTIVKKLVLIVLVSSSGQGLFLTVFLQSLAPWGPILSCPSDTTIIMLTVFKVRGHAKIKS